MMVIDAKQIKFDKLNEQLREIDGNVEIVGCIGQRFIGAGMKKRKLIVRGTAGNALGAYLNGAYIDVYGNAQDAVGDTMNDGTIIIRGDIGDTAGYAMRGGRIYIEGNAGYRAGVHMKAYKEKLPVMIIGGRTGSFLGEYQAGGIIVVLGLNKDGKKIVSNFPCTGMHGGKMFLRSDCRDIEFPSQVNVHKASEEEKSEISEYVADYCKIFKLDAEKMMKSDFTVVVPDSKNPYKQMYVAN